MAEKRLLVADADAQSADEFRLALGEAWTIVPATTCAAALEAAEKQVFSVVVANHELPDLGGPELLNRLRLANPRTIRFIAAPESLKEKVMHSVLGGDQFLSLPYDQNAVKLAIERSLAADFTMSNSVRELVGRIRTFPTIPSLYLEVVNTLQNPNATTDEVGAIIARDLSMTTKLVQVLNSSYFGLPRTITDPTEAVGILGFETVKSLIMAVKLLSQYDKVKPVYFSIDAVWRHSTNVARTARVMALLETDDVDRSATAYTAGLMHDLGKVILAANFDSQYHGAHKIARKQRVPLWEVEKDIFGATHGEIGAYLLSLWGMSEEVVRVAALHHEPMRAGDTKFSALTAVHVANALEYEGVTETDGLPNPVVDSTYLESLGMADRVELWRFARREPAAAKNDTKFRRATTTPAPVAVENVQSETADESVEQPVRPYLAAPFWKWLIGGVGLAAAIALVVSVEVKRFEKAVLGTQPPAPVMAEASASPAQSAMQPAAARQNPVASVPAPAAPRSVPAKAGFDRVQLQAIFYNTQHPSALINGKLAEINQEVADCRVLEIHPGSITLEYNHEQKTLSLR
jgi:HD-like signal output (HDOD) protein